MSLFSRQVYLDYAATRPVRKEVKVAVDKVADIKYAANTESIHEYGRAAQKIFAACEKEIRLLIAAPQGSSVIVTSGGTESNALAMTAWKKDQTLIVLAIEHSSIYEYAHAQKSEGKKVEFIPVTEKGVIDLASLKKVLETTEAVSLVSVQLINNELGTVQPIREISRLVKQYFPTALVHTDASQAPLFETISVQALEADMMTLCGHKTYGPKGVGVLYVKNKEAITPMFLGGGQQDGMRAGTIPTDLVVGFSKALSLAQKNRIKYGEKILKLNKKLVQGIRKKQDVLINGEDRNIPRLAVNISFQDLAMNSEELVSYLSTQGIYISSKSACMGAKPGNSYVIDALEGPERKNSIRFSCGLYTTDADIQYVIKVCNALIGKS